MIYLIAKFALLFLAATLLGLMLGYWWARSRFVDVSESYESLTARSHEDQAAMERIWKKVSAINLFPLENRVNSIEGLIRNRPEPQVAEPVNLNPVHEQINHVQRLVQAIPQPEKVDLLPLYQKIQVLEGKLNAISQSKSIDFAPITQRLHSLEGQITSLPQPAKVDLMPLNLRLDTLENEIKSIPQPHSVDLSPIQVRLAALENHLKSLPQPTKVDFNPVNHRLASLENQLKSLPKPPTVDINPVHQRLAGLENQIKALPQPATVDLSPFHEKLQAIDAKLDRVAEKSTQAAIPSEGPRLLKSATMGKKDDLKKISGVGPKLERLLNQIGVYYFWQVASWNNSDVQTVDNLLEVFKGRIDRDNWVSQAKKLKLVPGSAREGAELVVSNGSNGSRKQENGLSALFAK